LMAHVGLPDLVAATPDDYVAKAAALARDLPRLGTIRQTLRETMRRGPLCDAAKFTRELEAAYAVMCGPRETA
jgi:protein O-GlcNAc transferase